MNIQKYLEKNKSGILKTLQEFVDLNTYTKDKQSVDKLGKFIIREIRASNIKYRVFEHSTFGNLIVINSEQSPDKPMVLLSGHIDMVVPKDKHLPFKLDGTKCFGSGIQDMKGGIVAILYILKYLKEVGVLNNITVTFIPDEELGSEAHKDTLHSIYKQHEYALVYESTGSNPSCPENTQYRTLVTTRKGIMAYKINVHGKNGHSGSVVKKSERRSAISELLHKLVQIERLCNFSKGTTINVGVINGGQTVNTIADKAYAEFDVRFKKLVEKERVEELIQGICCRSFIKGIYTSFDKFVDIPCLEKNERTRQLVQLFKYVGKENDFFIKETTRGGGSDANQIGLYGLGIIDGMGTAGEGAHNPESFMYTQSIFDSIVLSVKLLEKLMI